MTKARDLSLAAKAPIASPVFTGNVGIGVTPETDWHSSIDALQLGAGASIYGDTTATGNQISSNARATAGSALNGYKYIATDKASTYQQYDGAHNFRVAPSGTADAAISWNTAMSIGNSGNVGIGTSSPAHLLDVTGSSTTTIADFTNTDTSTGYGVYIKGGGSVGTRYALRVDNAAGNERFRVSSSGRIHLGNSQVGVGHLNVTGEYGNGYRAVTFRHTGGGSEVGTIITGASSTSYNTSSDYRLKTDVQPMTGATATFMQLKPCNFEWIADGTRVDGFLAHELGEVIPAAVTGTKDAMRDEEYEVTAATDTEAAVMGTRSVPNLQGIDQSKLVPLLTATIQELITRIEALEA